MKKLLLLFCLISYSCQPPARLLVDAELGMEKQDIKKLLGNPESLALSFKSPDGKHIEVWNYRLYQYEMAMSISPYFDIYSVFFEDGKVVKIEKTEKGTRLSEAAALKMLGLPDSKVEVEIK